MPGPASDADAIDPDLDALYVLHAAGVRSLAVTWSRANSFGFGAPYCAPGTPEIGPGLTPAGIRLVRACNSLGMLVDLAHLNATGFRDVAAHSTAPLVVTHAAAHALTPTSRALTDTQLDAVAASGGIVGVSAEGIDLTSHSRVPALIQHITYMVERMGLQHVALGTDLYESAGGAGATGRLLLPELPCGLRAAGYADSEIAAIGRNNWRRVLDNLW